MNKKHYFGKDFFSSLGQFGRQQFYLAAFRILFVVAKSWDLPANGNPGLDLLFTKHVTNEIDWLWKQHSWQSTTSFSRSGHMVRKYYLIGQQTGTKGSIGWQHYKQNPTMISYWIPQSMGDLLGWEGLLVFIFRPVMDALYVCSS